MHWHVSKINYCFLKTLYFKNVHYLEMFFLIIIIILGNNRIKRSITSLKAHLHNSLGFLLKRQKNCLREACNIYQTISYCFQIMKWFLSDSCFPLCCTVQSEYIRLTGSTICLYTLNLLLHKLLAVLPITIWWWHAVRHWMINLNLIPSDGYTCLKHKMETWAGRQDALSWNSS